jgi:aerobic-type carbon monoxide dehydrogenase small subunit (CoxS/CutS family)
VIEIERRDGADALDLGPEFEVALRVNGRQTELTARAGQTLLEVLRERLALFGVREGCGVGMCGACTVLVDGRAVNSCLVLAPLADGWDITTIEGLEARTGELALIQQAFVDHTAFQCSYCTPGFMLVGKALLDEHPGAGDDEIAEELSGNLCRCGSYSRIMAAMQDARDRAVAATGAEGSARDAK